MIITNFERIIRWQENYRVRVGGENQRFKYTDKDLKHIHVQFWDKMHQLRSTVLKKAGCKVIKKYSGKRTKPLTDVQCLLMQAWPPLILPQSIDDKGAATAVVAETAAPPSSAATSAATAAATAIFQAPAEERTAKRRKEQDTAVTVRRSRELCAKKRPLPKPNTPRPTAEEWLASTHNDRPTAEEWLANTNNDVFVITDEDKVEEVKPDDPKQWKIVDVHERRKGCRFRV